MRSLLPILAFILCAASSSGQSILTGPANFNSSGKVAFFDLKAAKHLTVIGFDLHSTNSFSPVEVSIWKMKSYGSYANGLQDAHAWELLISKTQSWQGGYFLLTNFLNAVIPAGETQAFMIHAPCDWDLSIPSGAVAASTADLTLESGAGGTVASPVFYAPVQNVSFAGRVRYNVHVLPSVDLAVDSFTSPVVSDFDCSGLGNSEQVSVRLRNLGNSTIPAASLLQLGLVVDGQPWVFDQVLTAGPMAPGATFVHTFSIGADLSVGFSHNLTAALSFGGDGNAANDQLSWNVQGGGVGRVTSLPWSEDFEAVPLFNSIVPPPGWYQDPTDSTGPLSQWYFGTPPAQVSLSIHAGIPTSYASSSIPPSPSPVPVRLVSPCIELTNAMNPRLRFGLGNSNLAFLLPYSMLSVDVVRLSTGTTDMDVFGPVAPPSGFLGDFATIAIDLSPYAGDVIKIVFRADLSVGFPAILPLIDDVLVEEALPTPGQTPQGALAEFYLDGLTGPTNVNGDLPYVGSGGPYFITKSVGSLVSFDFEGVPFQPLLLLTGPLNPVAATFPVVGQMDIGGIPDAATGIPVGIQVVADGTSTSGINPLFLLNGGGDLSLWFTIPGLPSGPYAAFQAAILTGGANGSWIALSNAIRLDIQ